VLETADLKMPVPRFGIRTDCPFWGLPCSSRAAQNDASAGSRTERRTGDRCVEDHEHICADLCALIDGPNVVLARRSVLG
jgi:hypothetical protein